MNVIRKSRWVKVFAIILTLSFLAEIGSPSIAWALTSGPGQPEFSSFEPVTTTNMVDPFTGAFTYNLPAMDIPGPNGGGYAVSMSYHSGVSPEEESSWCGLGWTLNPGAINRQMRGIPDDFKGNKVTYYQKSPPNTTVTVAGKLTLETMSGDPVSFSKGLRYNNYMGFGGSTSIGSSFIDGIASLNFTLDNNGSRSYSVSVNPGAKEFLKARKQRKNQDKIMVRYADDMKDYSKKEMEEVNDYMNKLVTREKKAGAIPGFGVNFSNNTSFPTSSTEMKGQSKSLSISLQGDGVVLNLGPEVGLSAAVSIRRPNKTSYKIGAYGSMYPTNNFEGNLNDYHVEKDGPFDQRDFMLPIPFNQKDGFSVTGEGVRGGFQIHQRHLGHYKPKIVDQEISVSDGGADIALGLDATGGAMAALGNQRLSVGSWSDEGNTHKYEFSDEGDEPYFFRYSNDLGGNLRYTDTDTPERADVVLGFQTTEPTEDKHLFYPKINGMEESLNTERVGRSSYIDFNTYDDVNQSIAAVEGEELHYNAFSKSSELFGSGLSNRNASNVNGDALAEFVTTNNNGSEYVYGLPVYSADQASVSFSTNKSQSPEHNKVIYNNEIDPDLDANAKEGEGVKAMEGHFMGDPYANTFLLTEIHTPDYIDRTFDGPSNDDFGGWTKFNYDRAAGSDSKTDGHGDWYRWRMPYQGLAYSRNSLSDRRDDRGSVSSGVKELYYLNSIETKTHIAFFVTNLSTAEYEHVDGDVYDELLTGSTEVRLDGHEAPDEADALNSAPTVGTQGQKKLERIVLFAKNDEGKLVGKPLKVMHLQYDYSLCKGVPNNSSSLINTTEAFEQSGKLTLKKVWFEYEGITPPRIRPYEFTYNYKAKTDFGADIQAKYPDIVNYQHFNADPNNYPIEENPDYSPYQVDGWGNFRTDGQNRENNMQPWVQQTGANQTYQEFDPAAWNLKQIKLPSGGEILVNYEQHEYAKVMDKQAAQMVSITEREMVVNFGNLGGVRQEKFKLQKDDVDMDFDNDGSISDTERDEYMNAVNEYIDKNNGVYFKILYRLNGDNTVPSPNDCNTEFITGYVNGRCERSGDDFWIVTEGKDFQIPRRVCQDYYQKNRQGFSLSQSCYTDPDEERSAIARGGIGAVKIMLQIVKQLAANGPIAKVVENSTICKEIGYDYSYFRLPVPKKKKGGGIRVKRILMHDDGIEAGADEVLFGTEYFYQHLSGKCSGVASNEPNTIREENSLIQSLDKRDENELTQFGRFILFGPDRDQFEGPYGESILPGPSIGYQSVISQNIHAGKTTPGFQQQFFHTYAEAALSLVNPQNWDVSEIDLRKVSKPLVSVYNSGAGRKRSWAAQGFAFIQHDLHGKLKRTTQYAGSFTDPENVNFLKQSYTEYTYSKPKDKLDVMKSDGSIAIQQAIGQEEEIAMMMSEVKDRFFKIGAELDFGATTTAPVIVPNGSLWPFAQDNYTSHARHMISKIVRYTTVLKSTKSMTDGIVHTTENLVFDANTGDPVVVRTSDGYDGSNITSETIKHVGKYINYTIPAAHVYQQLGQKAQNQNFVVEGSFMLGDYCDHRMTEKSWLGNNAVCQQHNTILSMQNATALTDAISAGRLIEGDLIKLGVEPSIALFYISEIDEVKDQRIRLQPLSIAANALVSDPGPAMFDRLEVVKSGYCNQLSASTASLTTYGDLDYKIGGILERVNDQVKLKDNLTNVIAAAVTAYSDDWYNYELTKQYEGLDFDCESPQSFEKGMKGHWRPKSSYVYKENVSQSSANHEDGIYEGGKYTLANGFVFKDDPLDVYNDDDGFPSSTGEFTNEPNQNGKWVKTNQVNMYSPHGEPLEEENALGIKSTAKFAYGENVPILVAANAPNNACDFRSFEGESGRNITTTKAHSGSQSMSIKAGKVVPVSKVEAPDAVDGNHQMQVKFWCHATEDVLKEVTQYLSVSFENTTVESANFKQVARVGEWVLVEATVDNLLVAEIENIGTPEMLFVNEALKTGRGPGILYEVKLKNTSDATIFVDDIRVQPLEAEMTTYVYDPENLRLLTSFDDQHFGLFYQYNAEGQLVRKLIETERGIKTVTETQYHVPSVVRDAN